MDETTATIWQLAAKVDQMSAEYKDPDTEPERKKELYTQLKKLYDLLKLING